ncbi:MAG: RNA polymerase sigma factor [Bacteroidales bacterium]|mgnify:CR=1 FL=1|jgi:RNA polymerase sigma factor (sigma-70 family)|nr:RNA polymerase sigma factor [Bacteroidales bacterium]
MSNKQIDKKIIELMKSESNHNRAFGLLVSEYGQRLYWHIRKMVISHSDTDDILQNTLLKAYQGFDSFRGDSSLFTWLYKIATNETINFIDKKKRHLTGSNNLYEHNMSLLQSENEISGDQIQLKLQKAIQQLPDKQRLVFNMKYFDDMKFSEMSKILDTSVGALKASYHHAVKKIEKYLLDNSL